MQERRGFALGIITLALGVVSMPNSARGEERAAAQAPVPAKTPAKATVTPLLRNWTRLESWDFFEPPPGGGDPTYDYLANRLQFGLRRDAPRYEVVGALQYVQFGGLPARATGPGQLGAGATYYATNVGTDPGHLYLKYLTLALKNLGPGFTVRLGRMAYTSGAESASGVPKIEAVKRQRVDSRLIGEFEWSLFQRSFDGARIDFQQPAWQATAAAFHPTQGGFERRAGVDIADIDLFAGAVTLKPGKVLPGTEWQLFSYRYNDRRAVSGRPDNAGLPASRADVGIGSLGTTLVGAYTVSSGQLDVLLWLVGQTGTWYGQSHGANAFAAEGGYQWPKARWMPWLRAGVQRSSGDSDPRDASHGTFFPMMPTGRKYSLSATYAQANLDDRFAQVMLRPTGRLNIRADLHRLQLTDAADLWYSGSGATQASGTIFGFTGRASRGSRDLGTAMEGSADYTIGPHWSINGYIGVIRGGDVIRRTFAGHRLVFAYVENVLQF